MAVIRISAVAFLLLVSGCTKIPLTREHCTPGFHADRLKDACVVIAPPVSRDPFLDEEDLNIDLSSSLKSSAKVGHAVSLHYDYGDSGRQSRVKTSRSVLLAAQSAEWIPRDRFKPVADAWMQAHGADHVVFVEVVSVLPRQYESTSSKTDTEKFYENEKLVKEVTYYIKDLYHVSELQLTMRVSLMRLSDLELLWLGEGDWTERSHLLVKTTRDRREPPGFDRFFEELGSNMLEDFWGDLLNPYDESGSTAQPYYPPYPVYQALRHTFEGITANLRDVK